MENTTTKFEVGQKYTARSIGDHNCVWTFEIVRRTEKSVWVKGCDMNDSQAVERRKIEVYSNSEKFSPFGKYSMSPGVYAHNRFSPLA